MQNTKGERAEILLRKDFSINEMGRGVTHEPFSNIRRRHKWLYKERMSEQEVDPNLSALQ